MPAYNINIIRYSCAIIFFNTIGIGKDWSVFVLNLSIEVPKDCVIKKATLLSTSSNSTNARDIILVKSIADEIVSEQFMLVYCFSSLNLVLWFFHAASRLILEL